MWGQKIPYPHRLGLVYHVLGRSTYRWCALEIDGIHSVPLDCSSRAKGKVAVLGQSVSIISF